MSEEINLLRTKVYEMMIKLGSEEMYINHHLIYYLCEKYIKISYEEKYVAVEVADSLREVENNMYEDLDLYDYECMKEKDITKEIEKDLIKYVLK